MPNWNLKIKNYQKKEDSEWPALQQGETHSASTTKHPQSWQFSGACIDYGHNVNTITNGSRYKFHFLSPVQCRLCLLGCSIPGLRWHILSFAFWIERRHLLAKSLNSMPGWVKYLLRTAYLSKGVSKTKLGHFTKSADPRNFASLKLLRVAGPRLWPSLICARIFQKTIRSAWRRYALISILDCNNSRCVTENWPLRDENLPAF